VAFSGIPGREFRQTGGGQLNTRNKIGAPLAAKLTPAIPTVMEKWQ
jgi:hypothetical protein